MCRKEQQSCYFTLESKEINGVQAEEEDDETRVEDIWS